MLWFKVLFVSVSINAEFYNKKKSNSEKENLCDAQVK